MLALGFQKRRRKVLENSVEYQAAKERVEVRMGFYIHLSVFVAVILLLLVIDLLTSAGTLWFQWPLMGWGIAVVIHALSVFIFPNQFIITEEMIEKEMRKERNS